MKFTLKKKQDIILSQFFGGGGGVFVVVLLGLFVWLVLRFFCSFVWGIFSCSNDMGSLLASANGC